MRGNHIAAVALYNVFIVLYVVISSSFSSSHYYDELITKLQVQAIAEYDYDITALQRKLEEDQKEEPYNQNGNKRILIVDDEPDTCTVYQIVLEDAGYECVSYIDSVKALQEFRSGYYDLVILDIKMPVLNGFELCKKIIELDKNVPIIFITALPEHNKDIIDQSYPELRNTIYIQKPITNDQLVHTVNMTIATRDSKI
jgi:CheY-like chemotaxis protein